jgi:hypothetical protein
LPAIEHQYVFYLHIDTIAYYHDWFSFLSAFVPASLGMICLNAFGASRILWSLNGILRIEYIELLGRNGGPGCYIQEDLRHVDHFFALFFSCLVSSLFQYFARFSTLTHSAVVIMEDLALKRVLVCMLTKEDT